jgi:hypothetical protein
VVFGWDVNKGDYAYKRTTQARRANSFVEKRATGEGKDGLEGVKGEPVAIEVGDGGNGVGVDRS